MCRGKLYSEYYGETSDYTNKGGVICSEILLPDHAPRGYTDRQALWNAVEKAERGKNTQIAYSFDVALQNEFCSTSRKRGKEVCESHFIRAVVLEEGTLRHMQLVIFCIASHEDAFRRALGAKRNAEVRKELSAKRRMLQKSENRLAELDRLFKRIYEDMVNGKLSEARLGVFSFLFGKLPEAGMRFVR